MSLPFNPFAWGYVQFAPGSFNSDLQRALGDELDTFRGICDRLGITPTIIGIVDQPEETMDHWMKLSLCASALVTTANRAAATGDLDVAEKLANWALRLEESHLFATMTLGGIAQQRRDGAALQRAIDRGEEILLRLRSTPPDQLTPFEAGVLDTLNNPPSKGCLTSFALPVTLTVIVWVLCAL